MDEQQPAPEIPAPTNGSTKRVVVIGDYLGSVAGYATVLRRRRVLARRGKPGGDNVVRLPVLLPADEPIAHYVDTWKGFTETPGLPVPVPATPLLPDRKAIIIKWLLARAAEPSSWRGLLMCLTSIGITVAPDAAEHIVAIGIALAGAVGMLVADQPAASP